MITKKQNTYRNNRNLFNLPNKDGKTIADLIINEKLSFDYGDRQNIMCYLNSIYRGSEDNTMMLIKILSLSELFDEKKIEEYLNLNMSVTDYKMYYILKRYGIDVNEFGIPMKFKNASESQELQAIEDDAGKKLTAEDLIRIHRGYKLEFMVKPLVFKNGMNILGAERGTGKTRLCLSLAYHIIYGRDEFLGYPVLPSGDVLYINMEVPGREFSQFIEPIRIWFVQNFTKESELYILNTRDDIQTSLESIGEYIDLVKPTLVIIDSFKVFINQILVSEKKPILTNETLMSFYRIINEWKEKNDITVLLTNHTNKGTSNGKSHTDLMYGPGSLFDLADQTTLLRRAEEFNQRIIIPDKSRYSKDGAYGSNLIAINSNDDDSELTFDLVEEDVKEADYLVDSKNSQSYGDDNKAKAIELSQSGHSAREVGRQLNIPHQTISRWLKKLANAKDPF